jgi:hypothetical protein
VAALGQAVRGRGWRGGGAGVGGPTQESAHEPAGKKGEWVRPKKT